MGAVKHLAVKANDTDVARLTKGRNDASCPFYGSFIWGEDRIDHGYLSGWIAILPVKPSRRALMASARRPSSSRKLG